MTVEFHSQNTMMKLPLRKIVLVVSILFLPLCATAQDVLTTKTEVTATKSGELTSKNILENRDISQYDQGGHFDCHGWTPKEASDPCDEKKVRDFIWQHWSEKKRGYIRITYGSVDARSTSHIFIEPNEKGEWYIAWRIARSHMLPGHNNIVHNILGLIIVERVEGKEKDDWSIVIKRGPGNVVYKIPE